LGVRMYSSLPEIWRGWRKNFYSVSGNHPLFRAAYRLVLLFTFLVLPFVVLGYGIVLAPATPLNVYLLTGAFMAFFLWLGLVILDRPYRHDLNRIKIEVSRVHRSPTVPPNSDLRQRVSGSELVRLKPLLMAQPVRSDSAVPTVAVMPKPGACPHGQCTYSPG